MANAAAGHPALQELSLDFREVDVVEGGGVRADTAWLCAAQKLPALSSLDLLVHSDMFGPEEGEEAGDGFTARVQRACKWLRDCTRLTNLELNTFDPIPLHELLAAVGAAVGGQLRILTLDGPEVPTQVTAAEALHTLAAQRFPRLELLALQLRRPDSADPRSAEAVSQDLLAPLPALAPLLPALQEVRVQASKMYGSVGSIQEAAWLRKAGV